jgi:hypothetical protein
VSAGLDSRRAVDIANLPASVLIERLLRGELSLDDREVVLALWLRLITELDSIKEALYACVQ